jgi:hypothetical protein
MERHYRAQRTADLTLDGFTNNAILKLPRSLIGRRFTLYIDSARFPASCKPWIESAPRTIRMIRNIPTMTAN